MNNYKLQIGFFTILIAVVSVLTFFVFKPYLAALFLALIFRIAFDPIFHGFLHLTGKRQNSSAILSVCTLVVFIIAPVALLGAFLFDDVHTLYARLANGQIDVRFVQDLALPIEDFVRGFIPDFSLDVLAYARHGLELVIQNVGAIFSSVVTLLFEFFIMLLSLFYLFRDGGHFRKYIIFLSPLSDSYDETILQKLSAAVSSVIKGTLLVACIQGVLTTIGFFIFGIPSAVLWGTIAAISALIPTVGTALVLVPGIVFLFWSGSTASAVGLLIWGAIFVGLIDNFLAPSLMTRNLQIHPLLILLSVLGGLWFFGPVGFLAGPVLLTLLFALLDMYPSLAAGNRARGKIE